MASIYFKLDFTFHEASVAPSELAQQPRQLGDIPRDPPRLCAESFGKVILPVFCCAAGL